jgi:hypothetical protein
MSKPIQVAKRVHQRDHIAGLRARVVPTLRFVGQFNSALVNPMKLRARVGITKRHWYQVCGQSWICSSGGPSPPITACRRRPLAST